MNEVMAYIWARADAASGRHLMLAQAFNGLRQREIYAFDAFHPSAISRLRATLAQASRGHIETEFDILDDDLFAVSKIAQKDAIEHLAVSVSQETLDALSEQNTESHDTSFSFASSEILAQTERDVTTMVQAYRKLALRIHMRSLTAPMMSRDELVMDEVRQDADVQTKLWFRDVLGRQLPAQKFTRRVWRQSLRDHYARTYLLTIAALGETRAIIWHPETGHEGRGQIIHLDATGPGFDDYDDIFHPNANALPVAERHFQEITK